MSGGLIALMALLAGPVAFGAILWADWRDERADDEWWAAYLRLTRTRP